ncbi:metal-sensitive transcriptional regulator [Brenneria tiliae]|uniref:metal-sensitive transcriptional regulator n=1 Tax=Brenneria tiliae TaxID=2914984 RepID=UPI002014CEC7|nr:metal-sensitive transcriptional regulator [Brenneria tiliae]MCL2899181.1 metal-sensitive transcriptional regulator [Brenneria tiliae]MCL2903559.1 metal-sensitive transcriptional regulator [Brenneria tiliae]
MTSSRKCEFCAASDEAANNVDAHDERRVVQPRKKALLNRLSRINGQVNGIGQMIEQDRYCVDILNQISAARSALNAVANQLLADHTNGCVRKAVLEDGGEEAIAELLQVIQRMR